MGTEENCETKKAFFMGYIVHKMLMCSLGRLEEDDRDHFGKKRLEIKIKIKMKIKVTIKD